MEVPVLNGAGDISQHFRDEVGRALKVYRQTSQPACKRRLLLGFSSFFSFSPFLFGVQIQLLNNGNGTVLGQNQRF